MRRRSNIPTRSVKHDVTFVFEQTEMSHAAVNLSVGVDNLMNKTYSEHLNLAGNSRFGYSAKISVNEPGRIFWGKVSMTF